MHVFVDAEAVQPGSTKILEISIKPVTVHFLNFINLYLVDAMPFCVHYVDLHACCTAGME